MSNADPIPAGKDSSIDFISSFQKSDGDHKRQESVVDNLLFDIYDKWSFKCRHDSSWDSDTFVSASEANGFHWPKPIRNSHQECEFSLSQKSVIDLVKMRDGIQQMILMYSSSLVRQLRCKDQALIRRQKNCDILTAILQASSLKRREDTKLKFVLEPKPGFEAFRQWVDAMKGVARLPLGLPSEIRKKVWLSLANNHITVQKYDWNRVIKFAFNEKSNPDDDSLGLQIVKDLHRTGCDKFTTESELAILKRVLLAYARWNKRVGYCQGFNVLAAIILEVMDRNEDDSLKIMVYLVDHILPESYFAQNLQALSIDMAVFRELLSVHVPKLAAHLNRLQMNSKNPLCPNNSFYEPPLTNVFTMQWFLTLFATCLPPDIVLRIWDSIILDGSEFILRTGIVIWELLSDRLLKVKNADAFYCTMRDLTTDLLNGKIVQAEQLINRIYSLAPMPFPGLSSLRDQFTYNISPFASAPSVTVSYGVSGNDMCEDEADDDDCPDSKEQRLAKNSSGCFSGLSSTRQLSHYKLKENQAPLSLSSVDISQVGPGAVSYGPMVNQVITSPGATQERMSTNLTALACQYNRIKDKQKKTTLMMADIGAENVSSKYHIVTCRDNGSTTKNDQSEMNQQTFPISKIDIKCSQNLFVNHLLLTQSSTNTSRFIRQKPMTSFTSDANSIIGSADFPAELTNGNQNYFDFNQTIDRNSLITAECATSSVRPSSKSSSYLIGIGRSLSQSDLMTSLDDASTPTVRSWSFSCRGGHVKTLLQLTKLVKKDKVQVGDVRLCAEKPDFQPLSPLDLNAMLERHHRRIHSNASQPKYIESRKKVSKLLSGNEINCPSEIGHTARWVAENPFITTIERNICCRQLSMVTRTARRHIYNPLFSAKDGFYKNMAQHRLTRSRVSGVLHTAYTNEFQRSGIIQL